MVVRSHRDDWRGFAVRCVVVYAADRPAASERDPHIQHDREEKTAFGVNQSGDPLNPIPQYWRLREIPPVHRHFL